MVISFLNILINWTTLLLIIGDDNVAAGLSSKPSERAWNIMLSMNERGRFPQMKIDSFCNFGGSLESLTHIVRKFLAF